MPRPGEWGYGPMAAVTENQAVRWPHGKMSRQDLGGIIAAFDDSLEKSSEFPWNLIAQTRGDALVFAYQASGKSERVITEFPPPADNDKALADHNLAVMAVGHIQTLIREIHRLRKIEELVRARAYGNMCDVQEDSPAESV